jgi:hypothetical protein
MPPPIRVPHGYLHVVHRLFDDFLVCRGGVEAPFAMCIIIAKPKKPFVRFFSVLSHANPSSMVICAIHPPSGSDDDDGIVVDPLSNDVAVVPDALEIASPAMVVDSSGRDLVPGRVHYDGAIGSQLDCSHPRVSASANSPWCKSRSVTS